MSDDPILIKKYGNRKLYDSSRSRYITLEEIAALIRQGKQVKVLDSTSQQDLTTVTLAQIILEEEKKRKNIFTGGFLHQLIQYGELLQNLFQRQLFFNLEALLTSQTHMEHLWRQWALPRRKSARRTTHPEDGGAETNAASLQDELTSIKSSLERLERQIRKEEGS